MIKPVSTCSVRFGWKADTSVDPQEVTLGAGLDGSAFRSLRWRPLNQSTRGPTGLSGSSVLTCLLVRRPFPLVASNRSGGKSWLASVGCAGGSFTRTDELDRTEG